jgi:tetratricopeptide (TPR) repeat protein
VILTAVSIGVLFALQSQECPTLMARGRLAYDTRQFDQAAAEFRRALSACPDSDQVLLPLAQSQLMAQQFAESVGTLDTLLKRDPANVPAMKLKADALYLSGQTARAEETLLQARKLDPKNTRVAYALGRMYYQESRYPEAAEAFNAVLAIEADNYRAHDNLALVYEALHQDKLALKHYLKALDLVYKDHPEYDWAYANLANFMLERGHFEKAFQLAAEASKRNPASARNFFLTGKALHKLDKIELSVGWLKQSIQLDPKYPEPRYLLGQIYRKQGLLEESQRELKIFRELQKTPRVRR